MLTSLMFATEPEDYAFGVRATALDPDGNRIELRQPRRR